MAWRRGIIAPAAVLLLAGVPAVAHAAAPAVISGKLTGASIPGKGQGAGMARALSVGTGVVAATDRTSAAGSYRLTVPAGAYAVFGAVLDRRTGSLATRPGTAVSLKAGQRRTVALPVRKAKKKKKVRRRHRSTAKHSARTAYVQESGKVTPGVIAFSVDDFTGLTGEVAYMNRGLWWIVTGGMSEGCPTAQVANARERKILQGELDLQHSPSFDPATRVKRDFIVPDMRVTGRLRNTAGGAAYVFSVYNARSGGLIGSKTGEVRFNDSFFAQADAIGPALMAIICAPPPPAPPPPPPPPAAVDPDGLSGTFSGSVDFATLPIAPVPIRLSWNGTLTLVREPYGFSPATMYDLQSGSMNVALSGTVGDCAVDGTTAVDLVSGNPGPLPPVLVVDPGATPTYRAALAAQQVNAAGTKHDCTDPTRNGEQVTWPLVATPLMLTPTPQTTGSRFGFTAAIVGQPSAGDATYHWNWALSGPQPG